MISDNPWQYLGALCVAVFMCALGIGWVVLGEKQGAESISVRSTRGANCSVVRSGDALLVEVKLYPKKLGEYAEIRGIGRGVATPIGTNYCIFVSSDPTWNAREYIESPKELYSGDVVVVECGTVEIRSTK